MFYLISSHNQTGFIKDRYLGETVRSIFDIMEFTLKENIPGLMIFLDLKKLLTVSNGILS